MANSVFVWPGPITFSGTVTLSNPLQAPDGGNAAPSYTWASTPTSGLYLASSVVNVSASGTAVAAFQTGGFQVIAANVIGWSGNANPSAAGDLFLARDNSNILALKNGTNAQAFRIYGYSSGSRLAYGAWQTVNTAVTLAGASTTTGNVIPAGATVVDVSTSTTTTITGATGYQVGDGTTATRWGDITGTAVGTNSGSLNYTADPRWWTAAARAITLTAKTSNFTGGVVQVTVTYLSSAGA